MSNLIEISLKWYLSLPISHSQFCTEISKMTICTAIFFGWYRDTWRIDDAHHVHVPIKLPIQLFFEMDDSLKTLVVIRLLYSIKTWSLIINIIQIYRYPYTPYNVQCTGFQKNTTFWNGLLYILIMSDCRELIQTW